MWPVTRAAVTAAGVPPELVTPLAFTVLGLLEGMIVVCGIRARANVMDYGQAGVDGLGLWVAVCASSVISATEAALAVPPGTPAGEQLVTVMMRLIAPVAAGWLWERGLAPERRAARGERAGVLATYLLRPRAHLLSRAGNGDADAISRRRAATRAARLTERLLDADEQHLTLRQRSALRRLRKAIRDCGAAHRAEDRRYLLDDIAATRSAFALTRVHPPSPWEPTPNAVDTVNGARHRLHAVPQAGRSRGRRPEKPAAIGNGTGHSTQELFTTAFFPTGREGLPCAELDITRDLFADSLTQSGHEPSVNAVAKAVNRRWEHAKRLHEAVHAERVT
jgi:hypothetical protein